jgi:hypothetical protein
MVLFAYPQWDRLEFGHRVNYTCWPGYEIDDPAAGFTCSAGGQWEGKRPKCLPKPCPIPEVLPQDSYET